MYEQYYGFKAKPFDASSESDYFYLSQPQKQALANIREGLNTGGGFIVVTGLLGMGKTSLVDFLKNEQASFGLNIASISGDKVDDLTLLPGILNSFHCVISDYNLPALIANIESFIRSQVENGKRPLLVVDEAHKLSLRSLEVLRLLSNFQSNGKPSFQVILVGESTLNETLSDSQHRALQEQIIASTEIPAMNLSDTKNYVMHHLKRVGWANKPLLNDQIFEAAQKETAGIPSRVNQYFDRLLENEMVRSSAENTPQNQFNQNDLNGQKHLDELNKEELLAALNGLENLDIEMFEKNQNIAPPGKLSANKPSVNKAQAGNTNATSKNATNDGMNFGFDDNISLEETKRAFEGSGRSSKKSESKGFFSFQLVGVVLGSYLLSVVIAASIYYVDVAASNSNGQEVIMAEIG